MDTCSEELRLGHLRITETKRGESTVGQPLRDRISMLIESYANEIGELRAIIIALGHEKDELRSRASAAEARRSEAEYRAARISRGEK